MLILKIILCVLSFASSLDVYDKGDHRNLFTRGACSTNGQSPMPEPDGPNGLPATLFGPVTIWPICIPDVSGETFRYKFKYNGVETGWSTNRQYVVNPTSPGEHHVEFWVENCFTLPGEDEFCGISYGGHSLFLARPVELSATQEGVACQKSQYGFFETFYEITAPDPDGDDPSTVHLFPVKISDTSGVGVVSKVADLPNGKQRWALYHSRPGTIKFKIKGYNEQDQYGLFRETGEFTVTCNSDYDLQLGQIQFAQSVFMEGSSTQNNVKLIQGKPLMARLKITSNINTLPADMGRKIGVSVGVKSGSLIHRLVGCFSLSNFESGLEQYVEVFSGYGSEQFSFIGDGKIDVEINPVNGVSGILPEKGCGDQFSNVVTYVAWAENRPYVDRALYSAGPSPQLSLAFWNVKPECPFNSCDFNNEDDIQPFVQSSSDLLKAMYPISPQSVQVDSKPDWTVISAGFGIAGLGKFKEVCESDGSHEDKACYHTWATEIDLMRVKAAGLLADKGKNFVNRKYIGVVPRSGFFSQSYFQALHMRFPQANRPRLKGVRNYGSKFGDVVLVQSDFQMGLPHELVHSFDVLFSQGDPNETVPIHQNESALAHGFNFSDLSSGLREGRPSMMRADASFASWMDLETYRKLYNRIWGLPQNKLIDGEELLINGAVKKNGEFVLTSMYSGLKAGQTSGDSENIFQIYAYDPSGAVISQSTIPYDYGVIAESDEERYPIDMSFAPISTGIPFNENVFRVSLAPIGKMQASVKSYFPSVEILRTSIENIPNTAFIGEPDNARSRLVGIVDKIEIALVRGDIVSAVRHMKNELAPAAISTLKENFERGSILDVGRKEITLSVGEVSTQLESFVGDFPIFQNEFLRVTAPSELSEGQRAFLSIKATRPPERSDFEYVLSVLLDGGPQEAHIKKRGLEWQFQTPPLAAGQHQVVFDLFMQDARLAKALEDSIDKNAFQVLLLKQRLEETTDPSLRDELLKKIGSAEDQIQASKKKLQGGRVGIGASLSVPLSAQ